MITLFCGYSFVGLEVLHFSCIYDEIMAICNVRLNVHTVFTRAEK